MASFFNSRYQMRYMEDLAARNIWLNRLDPLAKLMVTIGFLVAAVSFDKYEIEGLLPLLLYPVIVVSAAEIPVRPLLKRILPVLPLIAGVGLFNPLFDPGRTVVLGITLSSGWISLAALLIKGCLTVFSALLLAASTSMEEIGNALRRLRLPRLFVLQFTLTFRYIALFIEEAARAWTAYSLRAPGHRGIGRRAWGPLLSRMVLVTVERAQRVYDAMKLRGFDGDYHAVIKSRPPQWVWKSLFYTTGWLGFFILVRLVNIPKWLGGLL